MLSWAARRCIRGSIAGCLCVSSVCCAAEDGASRSRELQSVTLEIGGGRCDACWRQLAFLGSGSAELRDARGTVPVALTEEEDTRLRDLLQSAELLSAVDASSERTCAHNALDNVLQLAWADGSGRRVVLSDGCGGLCADRDHPFMQLKRALFAIKEAHLTCPESPAYVCAVAPAVPTMAIDRMLCARCRDDCGIGE